MSGPNKAFVLLMGLFVLLIQQKALAVQVNCSDGDCSFDPSLDIRNDSSTSEFNQFEVRSLNSDLRIEAPPGSSPRSIRTLVESLDEDGHNLNLNLLSTKKLNSAGSAVVIGKTFKDVSINLNGRNGDGTPDASTICSQKILGDEYGPQIKSRYLLARLNDSSLPEDR